jgi:hypothetical protein
VADSDLAERYRFAPDDLAAVRAASRPDNWHGPLEAVELGGTLVGLDEIYRSLPVRRDQAGTALVGVGA